MGKDDKRIAQQCRAQGRELPDKIKNAPDLFLGLELYWEAFQELNTCRVPGMGLSFIPWTAIMEYSQIYGMDEEQTSDLTFFVRRMDTAFLNWYENTHGSKPKPKRIRKTHVPSR